VVKEKVVLGSGRKGRGDRNDGKRGRKGPEESHALQFQGRRSAELTMLFRRGSNTGKKKTGIQERKDLKESTWPRLSFNGRAVHNGSKWGGKISSVTGKRQESAHRGRGKPIVISSRGRGILSIIGET